MENKLLTQKKNGFKKALYESLKKLSNENLRDDFAKAAMEGIISRPNGISNPDAVAYYAYSVADSMLKERNKK